MKTLLFTIITIFITSIALAQPEILWQNIFGGTKQDRSYSIIQTNDGGYVMTGYTLSHDGDVSRHHNGQRQFWIVKTDANGAMVWEKSYGGSGYEMAYTIQQTSDNDYIVAGLTASDDGDITNHLGYEDIWVLKLNPQGNLIWQKTYGDGDSESVWEIVQTNDGGFVMAGNSWISTSHSDFVVNKIDADGELEWQNIFGFDNNGSEDYARSIKQTSDGGYIVAGRTLVLEEQLNTSDYWIVKLNAQGSIEWDTKLGGTNIEDAWDVIQTLDNGYVVVGHTFSNDGDVTTNQGMEDVWVVKLNSSGNLQWQKTYGGSGHDRATSIIQKSNGDYLLAGFTDSSDGDVTNLHGNYDGWLVKLDNLGNLIWQKTLGGSDYDNTRSVVETSDGGYAVTGTTNSNDTGAGTINGNFDFWIVKLSAEVLGVDSNSKTIDLSIYPNPTKNKVIIANENNIEFVNVYSCLGELIITTSKHEIDISGYNSGIYIFEIITEQASLIKRIIKI